MPPPQTASQGATQSLPVGTHLEEFVIERVLGSGGFGITYLARDKRLGRQVVIKENLPTQFCWRDTHSLTVRPRHTEGEDADNFQYSLESFEREAATLASLDHPGIVKVLRSFEAHGTAYFVMPFVDGVTFDEVIQQRRKSGHGFTEDELGGLTWRVLDALGYLHDRGIYHRDIKPGNILVTAAGDPVLIDFGAARQRLSERSLTVIESAGYTPFEQLQSRGKIGPWSDLYALGGTLYKAITGETPAKAADRAFDDPEPPLAQRAEFRGRYTHRFLECIDKAMAPRASDRFQNTSDWRANDRANVPETVRGNHTAHTAQRKADAEVPASQPAHQVRPQREVDERPANTAETARLQDALVVDLGSGVKLTLCYCPAGSFTMGSPASETDRSDDEDQVQLRITEGYWLAKTECTQAQWRSVMGTEPSYFKGDDLPVEQVSWEDAQEFMRKLNGKNVLPVGWKWSLPTEAQWEYACRAGTTGPYAGELERMAWYSDNSGSTTHAVGTKAANAWGLQDMHGNVWEWCSDWYGTKLPGGTDPTGASSGSYRVARGGSWNFLGKLCRSAYRGGDVPGNRYYRIGFRVASVPAEP